jgi:hypothetical protein
MTADLYALSSLQGKTALDSGEFLREVAGRL